MLTLQGGLWSECIRQLFSFDRLAKEGFGLDIPKVDMVQLALCRVCDTSGLLLRGNRRRVGEMYRGEFGGATSSNLVVKAPLI